MQTYLAQDEDGTGTTKAWTSAQGKQAKSTSSSGRSVGRAIVVGPVLCCDEDDAC
jgi:hypothetical protein